MELMNVSGFEVDEELEKKWSQYTNVQPIMYGGVSAGTFTNHKFIMGNYRKGILYIASELKMDEKEIENFMIVNEIPIFR